MILKNTAQESAPLLRALVIALLAACLATGFLGLRFHFIPATVLSVAFVINGCASWLTYRARCARPSPSTNPDVMTGNDDLPAERKTPAHRLTLATVSAFAAIVLGLHLMQHGALASEPLPEIIGNWVGGLALASMLPWFAIGRLLRELDADAVPEKAALDRITREALALSTLLGATVLASRWLSLAPLWAAHAFLIWVLLIAVEYVARFLWGLITASAEPQSRVPVELYSRQIVFSGWNPLINAMRLVEDHFGVSLRSSWAITFVKRAAPTIGGALLLLFWATTSICVVRLDQLAVREHFGRRAGAALEPGLHFKLPWPLGRVRYFPVKTVFSKPIGFVEADEPLPDGPSPAATGDTPRVLLWTQPHGREEFALVLGTQTELLAVNAILFYRIDNDPERFLDYVYGAQNAEEALSAFAHRALMELTRDRSLEQVLATRRDAFARELESAVAEYARTNRLGLEVVDLALVNLHPPIDAAADYLDVISARLDARRAVVEAHGEMAKRLNEQRRARDELVAETRVAAAHRIAQARGEALQFAAVNEAFAAAPAAFRLRTWIETLEESLQGQRFFLVDKRVMDRGGEMLIDARPASGDAAVELE